MFKTRANVVPTVKLAKEPSLKEFEPIVLISEHALNKMYLYCKCCDKEIGWLGNVSRDENIFMIYDTFLLEQRTHATTCEIDKDALAKYYSDLYINKPDQAQDIVESIKLWGHSHVNMSISPSGQDDNQMVDFKEGNEWFLRLIANKNGELEITLFDFKNNLQYKNVKWDIFNPTLDELEEEIKAEIKEKVKDISYTVKVNNCTTYNWNNYYSYPQEETNKTTNYTEDKTSYIYYVDNESGIEEKFTKIPNKDLIENTFSTQELKDISASKSFQDACNKINDIDVCNFYTDEDCMIVYDYATNKYPS